METIHVVVCGLETFEVQTALEGVLTQSHYAWKKSYTFACTFGSAVDFVHEDVFNKVCSVIVLCSGCTPPPTLDYYYNVATVAVPDCPLDVLEGLRDAEFFYGIVPLNALRQKVLSLALMPMHIIYDPLLKYFTPVGELAARRAFWILDRDCDTRLKRDDIVMWRRQVDRRDFELTHLDVFFQQHLLPTIKNKVAEAEGAARDVTHKTNDIAPTTTTTGHSIPEQSVASNATTGTATTKKSSPAENNGTRQVLSEDSVVDVSSGAPVGASQSMSSSTNGLIHSGVAVGEVDLDEGLTSLQFTTYLLALLQRGDLIDVWATLHAVGTHPNGLPYSWSDVHSAQSPYRLGNSYLSPYGVIFFRNVYKRAMPRLHSDVWELTPGCPWSAIAGIPTSRIGIDQFIEAWKYMALEQPDTVIIYARFWGYKGGPMQLFVRRNARVTRLVSEVVPNCVQVLVVGAMGSGRRSLVTALVGERPEPRQFDSSTTAAPLASSLRSSPQKRVNHSVVSSSSPTPASTPAKPRDAPNNTGRTNDNHDHHNNTSNSEPALFVRTTTRVLAHLSGHSASEPVTYVYTVLSPSMATSILRNSLLNRTIDVVLFCFDHTQPRKSMAVITTIMKEVRMLQTCPRMPFTIVGTKADLLINPIHPTFPDTPEMRQFIEFCQEERLLWPPMMLTAHASPAENTPDVMIVSEYIYHVVRDPDISVACPKVTPWRVISRTTILTCIAFFVSMMWKRVSDSILEYIWRKACRLFSYRRPARTF